jgi:hypothetical protein
MGNPITSLGSTPMVPSVELTLRQKIELGIEKSGVVFEMMIDSRILADSIMEVLEPPTPVEVPVVGTIEGEPIV